MKTIRILLADDHTVVRKGLRLLLESQPGFLVIADAANGREAVAMAEQHMPEVVVMDIAMPVLNYILKDSAEHDLIHAVQAVSDGKAFFSPAISKMLVEDYMRQMQKRQVEDSFDLLTTREREVLQLLAEGKNNKEAAAILNLSLHTVETHRSNILQKLNLHSGAELILYAIRKGVIS